MEPDGCHALISWTAEARAMSAATREVSARIIAQGRQLAAETARLQLACRRRRRPFWGQAQDGGLEVERR
jgi:hypothetical protein